jgi:hypothetical protein
VHATQYTIIVRGRLGERFASAFPGATLRPGAGQTRLDTVPLDQSQLAGLLEQLRNFAIELISVHEADVSGRGISDTRSDLA